MIFSEDSPVVQAWVRKITDGTYARENVPPIGNLREMVFIVLDKIEGK